MLNENEKEYIEQTPKFAEASETNQKQTSNLPRFRYHPNPLVTQAFKEKDIPETYDCCGRPTNIVYTGPFYSVENINYLCPECIANGSAAQKFDGEFQDEYSVDNVSDKARLDELIHRTPGYCGWQQEYWRAHCDDFCAFLGYVGAKELMALGIMDEVLHDPVWDEWQKDIIQNEMVNESSIQGYLFQCLHCGKHLLLFDCD